MTITELLSSWQFWVIVVIVFILGVFIASNRDRDDERDYKRYKKRRKYVEVSCSRDAVPTLKEDTVIDEKTDFTPRIPVEITGVKSILRKDVQVKHRDSPVPPIPAKSTSTFSFERDYTPPLPQAITDPEIRPESRRKASDPASKGEAACKVAIEKICSPYKFYSTWPKWLINPATGRGLELDLYNEELGLAVEYHGEQHYKYVPFYHKNGPIDLQKQIRRDYAKLDVCDAHGVYVIVVPYHVPTEDIENYIRYYMKENVDRREGRGK